MRGQVVFITLLGTLFGGILGFSGTAMSAAPAADRVRYFALPKDRQICTRALTRSPRTPDTGFFHADSQPLFDAATLRDLRELMDHFDTKRLGGFGFDRGDTVEFRHTLHVHLTASLQAGHVTGLRIASVEDRTWPEAVVQRALPQIAPAIERAAQRALQLHPEWAPLFEGTEVNVSASFLRYLLRPGVQYRGLPWHYDHGTLQVITPLHLPTELSGAHLQLRSRAPSHWRAAEAWAADIAPRENLPVFFENDRFWHQVTAFQIPGEPTAGAAPIFRDLFTLEFYPAGQNYGPGGWFRVAP